MKNKVELTNWMNGDKGIARAAWTSTQINIENKTEEQIEDLIVNKLWNNGSGKPHKTPFERGIVEFNITCEQASHIHLLKHRLANINGESARYKELKEDKFYLPNDWLDYGNEGKYWYNVLKLQSETLNEIYHTCLNELVEAGMPKARAKESARFFKMYNSQINSNKMMSFDGFVQIYKKRNLLSPSQKEIANVVEQMLDEIKSIPNNPFEYSLKAFNL